MVAGFLFRRAGAAVPSPNKLVLLRDADGDGVAEARHVLRDDLASPSGIAWHDGKLYVANHDAVLRFDYEEGATTLAGAPDEADGPAARRQPLDAQPPAQRGRHQALRRGRLGLEHRRRRDGGRGGPRGDPRDSTSRPAQSRIFGSGLRNPNGLAWNPWSGELWTTVNERDMLGSDLVPDYLTNVPIGAQYGWPWLYWGENIDERVEREVAPMPNFLTEYTRTPEFALGPHVAALGLAFTREGSTHGRGLRPAARSSPATARGTASRRPATTWCSCASTRAATRSASRSRCSSSFLAGNGQTHGRPTWVAWDKTGALLVSDDTANIIWRVTAPGAAPAPAPQVRIAARGCRRSAS